MGHMYNIVPPSAQQDTSFYILVTRLFVHLTDTLSNLNTVFIFVKQNNFAVSIQHFDHLLSKGEFINLSKGIPWDLLGLVSGATSAIPCSAAYLWAPALVTKFCSVHVNPVKH